ncbi:hypothetical protein ABZ848_10495 [Streptomyces sp. NPDC047081]|uniref:hypothetical protein n=1 Tax=Streptomyces sp. NPDC047081 TaxID=3154706 RepID=UPI0033D46EB4
MPRRGRHTSAGTATPPARPPSPTPYRYQPDEHGVGIGIAEVWTDPRREAIAITLPVTEPAENTVVAKWESSRG